MKTFIKISDNCIINTTKVSTIFKIETEVNFKTVYIIRYRINDNYFKDQYFDSKEERDNFFKNVCDDLMY